VKLCRRLAGEVPVTLVEDVDLEINEGEFVSVTGPSGSGKSSLLYLLGLLDHPTSGRLWFNDVDTSGMDDDSLAAIRLSQIGFVFQSHFLLPEFSVIENVLIPMQRMAMLDDTAARTRAQKLLSDLGLSDQACKSPRQLSGGQSQRVAIARALANDPKVVLADEPTGNLDTKSSGIVQDILRGLARDQGRAVIAVTHDQAFAATAQRRIVVVDGRIKTG
jgi:lipoprotein-releasing system ATP-binding protein